MNIELQHNYQAEVDQQAGELLTFQVPEEVLQAYDLPELPTGYGFSGGAARAVALTVLFGEQASIRDIDIVAFEERQPNPEFAHQLSVSYMPEDYAFGHGVQTLLQSEYFETRDFTVNEVAVVDNELLLTPQAYDDLRDKCVRLTEQEADNPKLAVKALLLSAVFERDFGSSEVAWESIRPEDISSFFVALGLNKAFQYGGTIPYRFVDQLIVQGMVSEEEAGMSPVALGRSLLRYTDFVFRGSQEAEAIHSEGPIDSRPVEEHLADADPRFESARQLAVVFAGQGSHHIDNGW